MRPLGTIKTGAMLLLVASTVFLVTQSAQAVPYAPGDVFVGVGAGHIFHYTPAGVLVQMLNTTSGSTEETGMTFDSAGNLYTTNFTAQNMSKFDNNGTLIAPVWAAGFHLRPECVVLDAVGDLYVGEVDGSPEHIHKFTPAGAPLATFTPAIQNRGTDWMDLAADNCTMFYTSEGNLVKRFNVCTNTQLADFAVLPTQPAFALRLRSNGELMVATSSAIQRLNAGGGVIQTYPGANYGENSFFALNLDPDGVSFWTAGYSTRRVYRIDIATGNLINSFVAGGNGPTVAGLAVFGELVVPVQPTTWGAIKSQYSE